MTTYLIRSVFVSLLCLLITFKKNRTITKIGDQKARAKETTGTTWKTGCNISEGSGFFKLGQYPIINRALTKIAYITNADNGGNKQIIRQNIFKKNDISYLSQPLLNRRLLISHFTPITVFFCICLRSVSYIVTSPEKVSNGIKDTSDCIHYAPNHFSYC